MMLKIKKIAVYARVSTSDQSCDMQLRELREYVAGRKDLEIYKEYIDEGYSGSTARRPALDALMADARSRKFSGVLVWRFDRFARSTKQLLDGLMEFRSRNIAFISLNENLDTSSPLGEAMFTIIGALAQLERSIICERVKAGVRNARESGKTLGRPKLRDDAAIRAHRARGMTIRAIAEEVGLSPRAVQRALKAEPLLPVA